MSFQVGFHFKFWSHVVGQVTLSNGIVKLTILKPDGALTAIQYGGFQNILDTNFTESQRGQVDEETHLRISKLLSVSFFH